MSLRVLMDVDNQLCTVLKENTIANGQPMAQSILSLLDSVVKNDPFDLPQVLQTVISFNPNLIVNKVSSLLHANQVADSISDLAKRYLSITVGRPGFINRYPKIENDLRNNVLLLAQEPKGNMARDFDWIVGNLDLLGPGQQ